MSRNSGIIKYKYIFTHIHKYICILVTELCQYGKTGSKLSSEEKSCVNT